MGRTTLRHLLQAFFLTAVLVGLGWLPARAWGGDAGLLALGLGALASFLGAGAGHLVAGLLRTLDPAPEAGPRAAQAGIAVRLLLTLFLALPVVLLDLAPPVQFAAWLGLHYVAQLVLEVFVSLRDLGQNHGPTEAAARQSQPEGTIPSTGAPSDDPPPTAPGANQG